MKKFLSLALSVLMLLSLLAGCGGGSSTDDGAQQNGGSETAETGGKLVVYSALNEDNTIAMAEQFEKDTGIEVEYISLGGGDAVARVQAEMSNPQADFLVGGSVDLYGSLAEAGALLEYDSPNNDDLDARFNDPNHLWQGWYMGVLSIIINEERFQEELASQGPVSYRRSPPPGTICWIRPMTMYLSGPIPLLRAVPTSPPPARFSAWVKTPLGIT